MTLPVSEKAVTRLKNRNRKSKKALEDSDILLMVYDGSEKLGENDQNVRNIITDKPFISVINKVDKRRAIAKQENEIEVSALSGENIEKLKQKIFDMTIKNQIDFNLLIVTNERQLNHLKNAQNQIEEIFKVKNESLEILSLLIKKSMERTWQNHW